MQTTTTRSTTETALQDLGAAVREGENLLKSETGGKGGDGSDLRAKLQASLDKATALYKRLEEKTIAGAKATDKAVREHPYHAVGVAFGVGLLIGVLAMRFRNRD